MSKASVVRIGTRGSELALWQARWIHRTLAAKRPDLQITIDIIKTKGDKILDAPLARIGDKGLFTREIEHALLDRSIDLAVHSLKDLPTELPPGLFLGAISEREDVRDVFIPHPRNPIRTLRDQQRGAVIATGSLRRRCQLLHLRPDMSVSDIRGNLNTRMKKLEASSWAGMILARAGVVRLGWEEVIGETIAAEAILPAVGQGALGVEIRENDDRIQSIVSVLNHRPTAQATATERALLRVLEGGCQVPIGTFGRIVEGVSPTLRLDAMVGSLDGRTIVRGAIHGDPENAVHLGEQLAEQLLRAGADKILDAIRSSSTPVT
jgi:hydroxymethylbilane synthase